MAYFIGQGDYSIDSKGRVNIPAKMRKALAPEANDTFVVTRGLENCISAYPLDQWKKLELVFEKKNQFEEKSRYFLRRFLMWAEEVSLDSQQRISLPKQLLEFSGIEKKVKIIGQLDHIEFWNPEEYEKYISGSDEPFETVAKEVMASDK